MALVVVGVAVVVLVTGVVVVVVPGVVVVVVEVVVLVVVLTRTGQKKGKQDITLVGLFIYFLQYENRVHQIHLLVQ